MAFARILPPLDRTQDFKKAQRHTRLVRRLRWLLPLVSFIIAVVFIGISYVHSLFTNIEIGDIKLDGASLMLQKPKIAGYDKQRRAYEVTAEKAMQSMANPRQVEMSGLEARMELVGNGWAKLKSTHGIYDSAAEKAHLNGDIQVTSSQGYAMQFEEVDIDMKASSVVSDKPVTASQGKNMISADRFEIRDGGSTIRFDGHVRAEFSAAPVLGQTR